MRELRDDLRHVVGWRHGGGPTGDTFEIVMAAIAAGTWTRLKACPDCRWVFYDNTRNGSKRWCLMTAGAPMAGAAARSRRSVATGTGRPRRRRDS